jgi:hypothetical protein
MLRSGAHLASDFSLGLLWDATLLLMLAKCAARLAASWPKGAEAGRVRCSTPDGLSALILTIPLEALP